jgi:hypothetical protein
MIFFKKQSHRHDGDEDNYDLGAGHAGVKSHAAKNVGRIQKLPLAKKRDIFYL